MSMALVVKVQELEEQARGHAAEVARLRERLGQVETVIRALPPRRSRPIVEAEAFLREVLREGPRPAAEVLALSDGAWPGRAHAQAGEERPRRQEREGADAGWAAGRLGPPVAGQAGISRRGSTVNASRALIAALALTVGFLVGIVLTTHRRVSAWLDADPHAVGWFDGDRFQVYTGRGDAGGLLVLRLDRETGELCGFWPYPQASPPSFRKLGCAGDMTAESLETEAAVERWRDDPSVKNMLDAGRKLRELQGE
jgi:hypothetical protein